jgi:predicted CopG family antitoxin
MRRSKPKYRYKTIAVEDDIHKELMMLKTILKKKNMSEVIRELINHRRKTMTKEELLAEDYVRMLMKVPEIVKRIMDVRTDVLMREIEERQAKERQASGEKNEQ